MAGYNYDVTRVTLFGNAWQGAEEWSTGFWLGHAESAAGDPSQAQADAMRTLWQTFFTSANAQISNVFNTVGVKLSQYPSGSDQVDPQFTVFSYYGTPIVGNKAGSPTLPPQIAVVASLHADPSMGLAGKGRMFLPGCHLGLNTDGQISPTERNNLCLAMQAFLQSVNNSAAIPGEVINASKGRIGVPFAAPVNRYVRSVRIGSVYDTQRRRRNGLTETYSSQAVASGV
jgi:hypothetical protein